MQTSTETRTTRTSGAGAPESRSNRDNRRGWWMAVATAAIVLTAVLAFNLLGPKNPVRPPGEGHETPASQGGPDRRAGTGRFRGRRGTAEVGYADASRPRGHGCPGGGRAGSARCIGFRQLVVMSQ